MPRGTRGRLTTLALAWLADTMTGNAWTGVLAGVLLMGTGEGQYLFVHPATRTDGLCGILLCLATAAGMAYVRRGRRAILGLALAMFLMALWCKEVALIWPVFVAAASFVCGFPGRAARLGGGAFAVAAAVWLTRVAALGTPLTGSSIKIVHYPLAGQLFQYASFLLSPILLHVFAAYPALERSVYTLLGSRIYRLLLGDLWFLAANVLVFKDDLRTFCLLWGWRLVMYLPSLPFARVYPHYWYIPMLGSCLLHGAAVVVLIRWLIRRPRRGTGKQGGTALAGPASR